MKKLETAAVYAVAMVVVATGAYAYNEVTANHAFEGGTVGGALPVATTVPLAGQVMAPGDYFPLVDFSPNYVAGHLLLRIPCSADSVPLVYPAAGHIDEIASRTYVAQPQLNLIPHASDPGKTCVYHSHVPAAAISAVGEPGPPRITDIGLINTCDDNVVFRTANAMSFTVLKTLGDINAGPYGPDGSMPAPFDTEGPVFPDGGDVVHFDVAANDGTITTASGNPCDRG